MDLTPQTESDYLEPDGRPSLSACPICKSRRLHYAFSRDFFRVARCADCRFLMLNPQPSDEALSILAGRQNLPASLLPGGPERSARRRSAAQRYLADIERYRGEIAGALLQIGCGRGELLAVAEEIGYHATGTETSPAEARDAQARLSRGVVVCGPLQSLDLPEAGFDVCVLCDVLEQSRDPLAMLRTVRQSLKSDGVLFIATPALDPDSEPAAASVDAPFEPRRLSYFDAATLHNALFQSGFDSVVIQPASAPGASNEIAVFARAKAQTPRRTLSIIVPAAKDAQALDLLMKTLLLKQIPGLDIQIVLVLSNPTAAVRDVAAVYADHARVGLVLEEVAYGKGHAVRAGLAHATGDFVLIQDMDFRYDLEDYDALLLPLLECREALVLGSRRLDERAPKAGVLSPKRILGFLAGFAAWPMAVLFNLLFGQDLADPFTKLAAFRKDCLTGIDLRCNGGELSLELLMQLLRKGHRPAEVPVSYRPKPANRKRKLQSLLDVCMCLSVIARVRSAHPDAMTQIERSRQTPTPGNVSRPRSPAKAA